MIDWFKIVVSALLKSAMVVEYNFPQNHSVSVLTSPASQRRKVKHRVGSELL